MNHLNQFTEVAPRPRAGRMARASAALSAVLGIGILGAPAANAAEPVVTVTNFDRTFTQACGGFDAVEHIQGTETIRRYGDRQETQERVNGSITNSVTGKSEALTQRFKIDFTSEDVIFSGLIEKVGNQVVSAGRLDIDRATGEIKSQTGVFGQEPNFCVELS